MLQDLQIPVAPLQGGNGPTHYNGAWQNEFDGAIDSPPEQGIPTIITWSYGGSNVAVEGSWDNWASRLFFITSPGYCEPVICLSLMLHDIRSTAFCINNEILCYIGSAGRPCRGLAKIFRYLWSFHLEYIIISSLSMVNEDIFQIFLL